METEAMPTTDQLCEWLRIAVRAGELARQGKEAAEAQLTAALQENAALTKQLNEAMGRSERDHMKDADRIASLESQLASGAEELRKANESVRMLADEWAQREGTLALKDHPHEWEQCPTWYDGCHCTVDTLRRAEDEVRTLSASLAAEKERGDRLAGLLAEVAITFRNYYAQAISRAAVETMLERMTAALSGDTPTTKEE